MSEHNDSPDKLMPCPFCGGDAATGRITADYPSYYVLCETDRCAGNTDGFADGMTQMEAVAAWNKREAAPSCGETMIDSNKSVTIKMVNSAPTVGGESSLEKAAQAWCSPETQHLDMIPELATEFANILAAAQAAQARELAELRKSNLDLTERLVYYQNVDSAAKIMHQDFSIKSKQLEERIKTLVECGDALAGTIGYITNYCSNYKKLEAWTAAKGQIE